MTRFIIPEPIKLNDEQLLNSKYFGDDVIGIPYKGVILLAGPWTTYHGKVDMDDLVYVSINPISFNNEVMDIFPIPKNKNEKSILEYNIQAINFDVFPEEKIPDIIKNITKREYLDLIQWEKLKN